jgi:diacylglycerol kinase (ATP)
MLRDDAGGVVVNVVHAGVAAEATLHAEDVKGLLGTTAYAVGAIRAGATTQGWRLRVIVDGEVVVDGSERTLLVTVGVGSTVGGGTPVAPGASPTDGLAEVVVASTTGVTDRLSFAMDLTRGEHTERDDVVVARGRTVTVEALGAEDCFAVNADGEVSPSCSTRTWTVLPSAWRCRVSAAESD